MKKKDLCELQAVCAIYALCDSLNESLYECGSDLPECIHADLFKHDLLTFLNHMDAYKYKNHDKFINACEDAEEEP